MATGVWPGQMLNPRGFDPKKCRWCRIGRVVSDRRRLFELAQQPYRPPDEECASAVSWSTYKIALYRDLHLPRDIYDLDNRCNPNPKVGCAQIRLHFAVQRHVRDIREVRFREHVRLTLALMHYPDVSACALRTMLARLSRYEPDIIDLVWSMFVALPCPY